MKSRRFVWLAASLVAASLVSPSAATAYVREMTNWNPSSLPIRYGINLSTAPSTIGSAGAQSAVEAGFASWAGPTCTAWRSTDTGNTSRVANTGDMQNTILWVHGSWPPELGDVNSTIGITTPVWQVSGYFIDADIQFNNVGFQWSMTGSGGTVDTQSIATHEEGHFLGLDHSPISSAIMYASYSGGLKRTLTSDDINGVCAIYPSGVMPPVDAGTPDSGSTMPGTGGTGSPCSSGSDCTSGICVTDGTNAFCTSQCTSDCTCPTGYSCVATMGGPSVCAPGANTCSSTRDSGTTMPGMGQFGDPCSRQTDCSGSAPLCVHTGTMPAFCSRACTDDCSCPAGYACFPTTSAGTMVCGPGTGSCSRGDGGVMEVDSGTGGPDSSTASDGATGGDSLRGNANPGCNCHVPGERPSRFAISGVLVALGAMLLSRRRRTRR